MEPRAQSSCFHANVWDNKSQGGSWVGGRGGVGGNIDRNRVGVQKEDAASAELAHRLSVAVELVGVEMVGVRGGLCRPLPGALGQPARARLVLGEQGGFWGCACRGHPDSKCSLELIPFPGL